MMLVGAKATDRGKNIVIVYMRDAMYIGRASA